MAVRTTGRRTFRLKASNRVGNDSSVIETVAHLIPLQVAAGARDGVRADGRDILLAGFHHPR